MRLFPSSSTPAFVLTLVPHSVNDAKIPHSLCYHLGDIFVDEVERLASSTHSASSSSPSRTLPLNSLLSPFIHTLAITPSNTIFTRLTENIFTPLLDASLPPSPLPPHKRRRGVAPPVRPEYPGILALAKEGGEKEEGSEERGEEIGKAVLRRLFEEGGKVDTSETNRRRIYMFVGARDVDLE